MSLCVVMDLRKVPLGKVERQDLRIRNVTNAGAFIYPPVQAAVIILTKQQEKNAM